MSQNDQQMRGTLGDALNDGDPEYHFSVTWTIDVDAVGPIDAAQQALEIMRDNNSIANVFTATDDEGNEFRVDLNDPDPEPVLMGFGFARPKP